MTTQSDSDQYYDITSASGSHLILFGELGEQWTDEVLGLLETEELDVFFFPWSSVVDLRLQLDLIYYPVVQIWNAGSLKAELVGYHHESLTTIIDKEIR